DDFEKGNRSQERRQLGALINFVPNDGDLGTNQDYQIDEIDRDDAHKIAVLDFLTLNLDRNIGNALTRRENGRVRLIPIDAGISVPWPEMFKARCGTTMGGEPNIDGRRPHDDKGSLPGQLSQSREPFSPELLEQIARLDPEAVAGRLRDDYERM